MAVVLRVEILDASRTFEFDGPFRIGNTEDCEVRIATWRTEPYAIQIGVLPHRAFIASAQGRPHAKLDHWPCDFSLEQQLRRGVLLEIDDIRITFVEVPAQPTEFDHAAAREFDRDVAEIEANRPPPRPVIKTHDLTMDDVTKIRDPDPLELVRREPKQLGDLQYALGMGLPPDLYLSGYLTISQGTRTDYPVTDLWATLSDGTLNPPGGYLADEQRRWLEDYRVGWSSGRAATEAALEQRYGRPHTASNKNREYRVYGNVLIEAREGDAFAYGWDDKLPDWAVRHQERARVETLEALNNALFATKSAAELIASVRPVAEGAGILVEDVQHSVELTFSPRISALELVLQLGWTNVGWMHSMALDSSDHELVHIIDSEWRPFHIGNWDVRVKIDGFPSGAEILPRISKLMAEDRVRWIHLFPRRQ